MEPRHPGATWSLLGLLGPRGAFSGASQAAPPRLRLREWRRALSLRGRPPGGLTGAVATEVRRMCISSG